MVEDFQKLKNKALPLPGHLDRLKMVHVDSQDIPVKALTPNLVKLYQKTLLEKLFLTGFFGIYE